MTDRAGEPLLRVDRLVKHFPLRRGPLGGRAGTVHALDEISFDLYPGETLAIVGESGCGKSTLARCVTRLLEPTSGTITFEGRDITGLDRRAMAPVRRDMMMIFQDPFGSLDPRMHVGAIVAEPLEIHHYGTRDEIRARVQAVLALVGLNPEHYNRYPHEFSGGQRQRIGIARALALGPKLVVCDEPVSALDVSVQAQILNLLADLQDELGLTYIFITHNLEVVRHVADPHGARSKRRQILSGDVPSPTNPPAACRFHTRCPKAQELCWTEDPPLTPKESGGLAACHFPLSDAEAAERIPSVVERQRTG